MNATLYLVGCLLVAGQADYRTEPPTAHGDWLAMPRLTRAQEMVYRGVFTEEARGGQVQFNRAYRLESRIFVLETPSRGAEVAVQTVLKHRDQRPSRPTISSEQPPSSVRLERLHVTLQGQVKPRPGTRLTVPIEGAPTLECGMFVYAPSGRIGPGQSWQGSEEGRPDWLWRATQRETVAGNTCIKLVGVQQSDDWDRPRGDHTAWRRTETVWMSTTLGYACRVERRIERREPAHQAPTQGSLLRYELESTLQYPGPTYELRRQDIVQALELREVLKPLLAQPARYIAQLTTLSRKIGAYLEHHPETPYRESILQVQRQAEAAEHGEAPPAPLDTEPELPPATASLGEVAPDFLTTEYGTGSAAHLRRGKGAPILLVFYNPSSSLSPTVLAFTQRLYNRYSQQMTVLGMSVVDDSKKVTEQKTALKLTFPLLSGSNLRNSYAVTETPKIVLLDASQVVRGSYVGWGAETPAEIAADLKRWLPRAYAVPAGTPPR
jgi:peroxiredoxin